MRPSTRMVTAATAVMAFAGVACSGADSISASDASRQEPLAAVSITPSATSVILGDSVRLSASLNADSSGSAATETAQWTTSDPSVAQVSADGVVSSVDSGSATITARLGTKTGIAKVQVLKTSVASIAITPATSSIQSGQKQQLVATGTDDNGRTIKNLNVKWSSSNPALASVTGNGLVTGIAKGTCVITAQVQGRRATATVTVLDVPVATVAVTLGAAQIAVGQTTQASVTLKDASGSPITGRTVAWQSSNPAMATVNASGLVTALAFTVAMAGFCLLYTSPSPRDS